MRDDHYDRAGSFLTTFMSGVFGLIFLFFALGIVAALWPWPILIIPASVLAWRRYWYGHF
jgi:hypothetical protein